MLTTWMVLVLLAAVVGSGAMVAVLGWMALKLKSIESGGSGSSTERLREELHALRAELETANRDIVRLTERVDFTERLLEPGEDDA